MIANNTEPDDVFVMLVNVVIPDTFADKPAEPPMVNVASFAAVVLVVLPAPAFNSNVLGTVLVTVKEVTFATEAELTVKELTVDPPEVPKVIAKPVNSALVSTKVTVCESPVNCKFNVPAPVA